VKEEKCSEICEKQLMEQRLLHAENDGKIMQRE
jgi:hypothetical protein